MGRGRTRWAWCEWAAMRASTCRRRSECSAGRLAAATDLSGNLKSTIYIHTYSHTPFHSGISSPQALHQDTHIQRYTLDTHRQTETDRHTDTDTDTPVHVHTEFLFYMVRPM